ncbi:MAG: transcription elongation factor Spt5 [Candidatus Methanomethylophilaceae archaeon]|nr:transcription elongation factor Spt5 [Candidatus Methanomethylophilaceae archaeon]MBQ9689281.1 transcription elongation factor Spt5 [Candidatus Methanomethylophilaceae archaeon]MBR1452573.1 transcription elongation factor Spt5 [Candidatus Methanomethylophilaceae archaeon]
MMLTGDNNLKKVAASGIVNWTFQLNSGADKAKLSFSVVAGPDAENAPEWTVSLLDATEGEIWTNDTSRTEITVPLPGKNAKELKLQVICPNGARYGDSVTTTITADADDGVASMVFEAVAQQSIMVLKTQIDQEKTVANELASKANKGTDKDIYAILSPAGLRGYVFVEGMNTDRVREKSKDIKKARNFIEGEADISEISPYLTPVSAVVGIVEGDLVELINGPFKGEKARVQQIDQAKEEITVELTEAMVPIPVTVKGDSVRLVDIKEK